MKESMWLRRLLDILGYPQLTSIIYSDNSGSMALTKDPSLHAHSKHIDVQFHYTREHVEAKDISFCYVPTADMLANIMTKALPHAKHEKFTTMLGLHSTL